MWPHLVLATPLACFFGGLGYYALTGHPLITPPWTTRDLVETAGRLSAQSGLIVGLVIGVMLPFIFPFIARRRTGGSKPSAQAEE